MEAYLNGIEDEQQRADSFALVRMMEEESGAPPVLWGGSIIGFGNWHYVYKSGREGDWFQTGFAPRKGKLSIYLMSGFSEHEHLLAELGPHKIGKGCLYIKRLEAVNKDVLRQLIRVSIESLK